MSSHGRSTSRRAAGSVAARRAGAVTAVRAPGRAAVRAFGDVRAARLASRPRVAAAAGNGSPADVENVVIIGSGPAGFTAAIYAARANLKPFLFEGYTAGGAPGGQLMSTTEVENFPGFPEGITGPELMENMRKQAYRWGTDLVVEDVAEVDCSQRPFVVKGADETVVKAHSIIIATGAVAKKLGIPSENKFWSNGISACAICDGASPLFRGKEVAVVGGGDSAAEEAVYMTKYASHVHLLVRGDKMRASKAMVDRAHANPKVTVHYNTTVDDAYGGEHMEGLTLNANGEKKDLKVAGMFYGIGHTPNSSFMKGQIETDETGYVKVDHRGMTTVEGIFAAGDLHDHEWRQAVTAAGAGCRAALAAERWLVENDLATQYSTVDRMADSNDTPQAKEEPAAAEAANGGAEDGELPGFNPDGHKHRGGVALRKLYHESDRLLLVVYTSPTCGPCKSLKPILNRVADDYPEDIEYIEIDIEADPEIAQAGGVNGTPTVQLFKDKAMVQSLPGVKMKGEYKKIIDGVLAGKVAA
ncbi:unnamed protein product [Pedinophyceae sp. YPF-701]|nr:unnamed protein product [Pedinophyceae sp. YPF-701]